MSPAYIPKALREKVAAQARYRCGYCLTTEAVVGTPMELDHFLPTSRGGPTEEDNLWLACSICNEHKGQRVVVADPATGDWVPVFDPRHRVWSEHFQWTPDGARVVGLTAIGRATVAALNLNRPGLVRARALWVSVGWHPPQD